MLLQVELGSEPTCILASPSPNKKFKAKGWVYETE